VIGRTLEPLEQMDCTLVT